MGLLSAFTLPLRLPWGALRLVHELAAFPARQSITVCDQIQVVYPRRASVALPPPFPALGHFREHHLDRVPDAPPSLSGLRVSHPHTILEESPFNLILADRFRPVGSWDEGVSSRQPPSG